LLVTSDLDQLICNRAIQKSISSKSFIVTVFGDVVSQHGETIWLGSLIEMLSPLGFSERLVRTSVFRLVKENWLKVDKRGRKSFYGFTESANKQYRRSARRIYAGATEPNDGRWLIVMPAFVNDEKLSSLKRQLHWLGFSSLVSGAYAHPSFDQSSLEETIKELQLSDQVIVFSSFTLDQSSEQVLKKLVQQKWNLDQLKQEYQQLLDCYRPVLAAIENGCSITDFQATLIRTLLIHEYRRILLNDHELPKEMLPLNWPGFAATELVKILYARLANRACRYITSTLENESGLLPSAGREFSLRFK
jgi:phenylacetic acid degradation operon negative regulatory protein